MRNHQTKAGKNETYDPEISLSPRLGHTRLRLRSRAPLQNAHRSHGPDGQGKRARCCGYFTWETERPPPSTAGFSDHSHWRMWSGRFCESNDVTDTRSPDSNFPSRRGWPISEAMRRLLAPLGTLLVLLVPVTGMFVAMSGISLPWLGMEITERSVSHGSSSVVTSTVATGAPSLFAAWAMGTAFLAVAAFKVRDRSSVFVICAAVIFVGTLFIPIPLILTSAMLLVVLLRDRHQFFGPKPPPMPFSD